MGSNVLLIIAILIIIFLIGVIAYMANPDVFSDLLELEEQPPPPPETLGSGGGEEQPPTFPE